VVQPEKVAQHASLVQYALTGRYRSIENIKKGLFSLAIGYSLIGLTLKKVNVNSRWGTRKNEGFVLLGALVAH
jgi:hypothetical protein